MAKVKTFRINPKYGVPDKELNDWLTECEETEIINVQTVYIPAFGVTPEGTAADPRLTVIVTKLDDLRK